MSIKMENPKTLLEKIDAASNLVEQMHIAYMMKDEKTFTDAHRRAGDLLLEAMGMIDED